MIETAHDARTRDAYRAAHAARGAAVRSLARWLTFRRAAG